MVGFYDPVNRTELGRVERVLATAGIEFVLLPREPGSVLPGTIGVAEEDLPHAAEVLEAMRTRH